MTSRGFRVLLGILAFVLLYLVALALSIPKIENNLTSSVTEQLVAGGVTGVVVTFSGRDATTVRVLLATKDAALAAVTDQWGIRSPTYTVNGADVVVPTTTAETATSTVEVTTTSAAPTTTVAEADHDDGRGDYDHRRVDDDHRRGSHVHRCNRNHLRPDDHPQRQRRLEPRSADAGRRRHGRVRAPGHGRQPGPPSSPRPRRRPSTRAVDGLAAFITAASPGLLEGSGHLVNQGLAIQGQAFSAAAATAFNNAVASAASQFGVKVTGTVSPGPSSPSDREVSLTALVGRSGVNFTAGSAAIDPPSQVVLNSAAETIKQVPTAQVQIVGYTDSDGTPEANLTLSQERADAVKTYLVGRGVPADSLDPRQGRGGPPRAQRHAREQGQEPPHRAHSAGELTDPCCMSPERS